MFDNFTKEILVSRNTNGKKIRSRATYSDSSLQVSPFFESSTRKGEYQQDEHKPCGGNAENNGYTHARNKKTSSNITINNKKG